MVDFNGMPVYASKKHEMMTECPLKTYTNIVIQASAVGVR